MAEPLKPCAFCASNNLKPLLTESKPDILVSIVCTDCNARGPSAINSDSMTALSKASEYWNIRK